VGHTTGRGQFRDDPLRLQGRPDLVAGRGVPLRPGSEVFTGWQSVAFLDIALAVGKHEVVPKVHGIPSPRL
jgi:hypothetical protein